MPIENKKSAFQEDKILALARKHQTSPEIVDGIVAQLEVWMFDQTFDETADDLQFHLKIERERAAGEYHAAALIWFVQATKSQQLDLLEAADILIALLNPGSV